jgi:hypothetical protein
MYIYWLYQILQATFSAIGMYGCVSSPQPSSPSMVFNASLTYRTPQARCNISLMSPWIPPQPHDNPNPPRWRSPRWRSQVNGAYHPRPPPGGRSKMGIGNPRPKRRKLNSGILPSRVKVQVRPYLMLWQVTTEHGAVACYRIGQEAVRCTVLHSLY